jgi:hypothetical protein
MPKKTGSSRRCDVTEPVSETDRHNHRFAADSSLEGDGFEPSVPHTKQTFWLPVRSPQFRLPQQKPALRARDRWFESISLQTRVCELSVPRRRSNAHRAAIAHRRPGASLRAFRTSCVTRVVPAGSRRAAPPVRESNASLPLRVGQMGLAGIRYPLTCQPAYRFEWAITVSHIKR